MNFKTETEPLAVGMKKEKLKLPSAGKGVYAALEGGKRACDTPSALGIRFALHVQITAEFLVKL